MSGAEVVITEFMERAAVADLARTYAVRFEPDLHQREDALRAAVAGARALIVRNRTQVRAPLLDAAPRLEVIGRLGVGLDNIDLGACAARGIPVVPATGANDVSVAEYVIAAALVLLRGAFFASDEVRAGAWPRERLIGRELSGKRLGLVGFGAIARLVAKKARALEVTVLAYDPYVAADDPAWAVAEHAATLRDLLAAADVVSLHVPLSAGTRNLLDAAAIAGMRPGAVLINAARGGLLDEAALIAALRTGALAGAALDVFEDEPLTAAGGARFADVPNLILTPHIAGPTQESDVRVSALTAANVRRVLEGRA